MKNLLIALLIQSITLLYFDAHAQDWVEDYQIAQMEAEQSDKLIFMVFQGSDWCAPCIRLERDIWSSSEFSEFSKENFVLLRVDFPRRKKNKLPSEIETQNKLLAEQYNQQGIFPLVVLVDPLGNVIAETGYKDYDPEEYISHLENLFK